MFECIKYWGHLTSNCREPRAYKQLFLTLVWLCIVCALPYFQLGVLWWRHLVARLNVDAQLQTFPYPTISKPLLSSNDFWAKSFSQTLRLKSMMDGQTDQQIKTQHFWLCWQCAKSEHHRAWHGDRGPRALSSTSKNVSCLMRSFTIRGRWKFEGNWTH